MVIDIREEESDCSFDFIYPGNSGYLPFLYAEFVKDNVEHMIFLIIGTRKTLNADFEFDEMSGYLHKQIVAADHHGSIREEIFPVHFRKCVSE